MGMVKWSLYDIRTAYVIAGALILAAFSYILMSIIARVFKKERYRGLKFTTKNIAYIAMLTTVSVTATVVIGIYMPAAILPPIRIAIEGLMVKIAGYIFGPIVGILVALISDLLIMLFLPSFPHIAYILTIFGFGFISGLVGELRRMFHQKTWILLLITHIFIVSFGVAAMVLTQYAPTFTDFKIDEVPLTKTIPIKKWLMLVIIGLGTILILILLWTAWLYYKYVKKDTKLFDDLVPVILLAVINEYLITVFIASWGDVALFTNSVDNFGLTMIPRLAIAPVKIFFNTVIIYVTWRTVRPLINRDY